MAPACLTSKPWLPRMLLRQALHEVEGMIKTQFLIFGEEVRTEPGSRLSVLMSISLLGGQSLERGRQGPAPAMLSLGSPPALPEVDQLPRTASPGLCTCFYRGEHFLQLAAILCVPSAVSSSETEAGSCSTQCPESPE